MDQTYIYILFAQKPSEIYVALAKTTQTLDRIKSYLSDPYLAQPSWKYDMIRSYLDLYKSKIDSPRKRS